MLYRDSVYIQARRSNIRKGFFGDRGKKSEKSQKRLAPRKSSSILNYMTDTDLETVAARIASLILEKLPAAALAVGSAAAVADAYPEKLSRTQAARFVGGKPFKRCGQASGSDQALLRDLRVRPLLTRHHFHGRETRARDYFSKTALAAALAARRETDNR